MATPNAYEITAERIAKIKDENIRNALAQAHAINTLLHNALMYVQEKHEQEKVSVGTIVDTLDKKLDTNKQALTDKNSSLKTKTATINHKIKDRPSEDSLLSSSIKGKECGKVTLVKSRGTFKNEQQPLASFMFHCFNRRKNTDFIINRMQSLNVCCMYSFLVIKSLVKWCAITITGADFRWWRRAPPWLN